MCPVLRAMSRPFERTCQGVSQCMSKARGKELAGGASANSGKATEGAAETDATAEGIAEALGAAATALGAWVATLGEEDARGDGPPGSPHAPAPVMTAP